MQWKRKVKTEKEKKPHDNECDEIESLEMNKRKLEWWWRMQWNRKFRTK